MITTFLIIRHAESVANAGNYFASQSDSPLSERGVRQVRALSEALARATIHAVYSSDLSRARLTVEPLARARDLPVIESVLLRERNMGAMTGLTFDQARERFPEVWARMVTRDPTVAPPGGESHLDLAARVRRFLDEVTARHRGQTVVIGSHGGTIHHLIRQLVGLHDGAHGVWFMVANASVTRVDLTEPVPGVVLPRLMYVNRVVPGDDQPLLP